jgi:hypothetical protein
MHAVISGDSPCRFTLLNRGPPPNRLSSKPN